ncbi:penicillin amidase [Spirosomataceae bacterium TFI 002]|nr:penicillin amidase [Spirosomataceae bacterium TFI 002]
MNFIKKLLWALLAIIIVLALGVYLFLKSTLPNYDDELKLAGLVDKVEVIYDEYAVPHIYAQNEHDVYFAFGYVHAQERLFQMEVLRRLADGRLSEIFGEKALETDKFFRTLSFRQHAKMAIAAHDPNGAAMKASLAYMEGLNSYLENGKTPIEFSIIGIEKKPFTLEDMEMIVGYMGYTFEGAFKTEALATKIVNEYGIDYMNDIFNGWPDSLYQIPIQQYNSTQTKEVLALGNKILGINATLPYPPFHGSNGWVVSGAKTKSGKPILANDTHIAFSQPSVWFEAHLECPGLKVYGNFLAGVPFAALGHSDFGAWGITMFENDEADFFAEKPNPENQNQVWDRNHWVDLEIRNEVIKVKDQADVVLEVKKSKHGYILNEAFEDLQSAKTPVAMWWVYHELPSKHLEVFYNLSKSKNALEAREAVKPLTAPGLNIMWADVEGNIAWWAAGAIPKRPAHVNPMLILDGSTGNDDFLGWEPFENNPQILNPESGVLYTANNQPADMGNGKVAGYYVPANRARRIEELIFNDKKDWDVDNMRIAINDVTSPFAGEMTASLLAALDQGMFSDLEKEAFEKLKGWKGEHELESIAPTIFYRWQYYILKNTFEDELGEAAYEAFEHNVNLKRNMNAFMSNPKSRWWDNINTRVFESRELILRRSFNQAIEGLKNQLGDNTAKWEWKKVHTLTHNHPLSAVPSLAKWFNVGPLPAPGGRETINNLDFVMDSTGVNHIVYGPALRRIIDMSNTDMGYSVNPTGQSGNFMSKHYDDQAEMFVNGGSRAELKNRKLIEANSIGKTILQPK